MCLNQVRVRYSVELMFRHFLAAVDKYGNESKFKDHKHRVRLLRQLILLILDRSKQSTVMFMKILMFSFYSHLREVIRCKITSL